MKHIKFPLTVTPQSINYNRNQHYFKYLRVKPRAEIEAFQKSWRIQLSLVSATPTQQEGILQINETKHRQNN